MDAYLSLIMGTAAIAIVLNIILKRIGMPTLIGYIASGAVVGAFFMPADADQHVLHEIAEFGIVFLMFNIGLEFSVRQLQAMKREVLGHGGLQVILTGALFAGIARWGLGLEWQTAVIIGSALSLSSTATVLKILNERHEIGKPYGRQALGILLFQDMAVIPIFLMIQFFTQEGDQSVPVLLVQTLIAAVVAMGVLYLVTRFVITRFLNVVSDTKSHELFVAAILLIVVASAYFTHAMGFSWSLGAFFAALMISETKYKYQIEADLNPFRDLLLGVFFVTVGLQIDFGFLATHVLEVLVVLAVILAVKAAIIFAVVVMSEGKRTAIKTALAIAQGGEFSFAVFELARGADLIAGDVTQTMVLAVVLSIVITPFLLRRIDAIAGFLSPRKDETPDIAKPEGPAAVKRNHIVVCGHDTCFQHQIEDGHMVVCGYGPIGREVVRLLREAEMPYVAIEHDRETVGQAVAKGDAVIFGNATQRAILESAWVGTAGAVIIAMDDPNAVRLIAEAVSEVAPKSIIVVKLPDAVDETALEGIPVKAFIHQREEVARKLLEHALMCEVPLTFTTPLFYGEAAAFTDATTWASHSPPPLLDE